MNSASDTQRDGTRATGAKKVLVASVGLSPVPVALSVLTLRPELVVLVQSQSSKAEAARVVDVIAQVCERDGLDAPVFKYINLRDNDTRHLGLTRQAIGIPARGEADHCEKPKCPSPWCKLKRWIGRDAGFILDYTGGTKPMVSVLVEFHIAWHGVNLAQQRCYVEPGKHHLAFGAADPHGNRYLPLFNSLTLTDRANLNGFSVTGYRWEPQEPADQIPLGPSLGWPQINPGPWAEQQAKAQWQGCFDKFYRSSGLLPVGQPGPRADLIKQGTQTECVLAALLSEYRPNEMLFDVTLHSEREGDVEFDSVWRDGNRIFVAEAKRSMHHEHGTAAATRVLMASQTFGATTSVLLWAGVRNRNVNARKLKDNLDGLSRLPHFGHGQFTLIRPATGNELPPDGNAAEQALVAAREDLRAALHQPAPQELRVWDPWSGITRADRLRGEPKRAREGAGRARTALQGVGGSPLATAIGLMIPEVSVSTFGSQHEAGAYRGFLTIQPLRIDALTDEAGVFRALAAQQVDGYVVTPGTKALTAAMTALAVETDRELWHVDGASWTYSTRSSADGERELDDVPGIDWPVFLEMNRCAAPGGGEIDKEIHEALTAIHEGMDDWHAFTGPAHGWAAIYPGAIRFDTHGVVIASSIGDLEEEKAARDAFKAKLALADRLFGEAADQIYVTETPTRNLRRIADQAPLSLLAPAERKRIRFISTSPANGRSPELVEIP